MGCALRAIGAREAETNLKIVPAYTPGMNGRRPRHHIRIRRGDILVVALLLGMMIGALLRWPEKAVADIAIPARG